MRRADLRTGSAKSHRSLRGGLCRSAVRTFPKGIWSSLEAWCSSTASDRPTSPASDRTCALRSCISPEHPTVSLRVPRLRHAILAYCGRQTP
jgi:hypothetical protein